MSGGAVLLVPGESQECGVPGRNQNTRKRAPKLCRMNTYANYLGGQSPGKALLPPILNI